MKSFSYTKDAHGVYFPIIDFFAHHKKKATRVFALVDSGATTSIFSQEIAEELDLTIESGKEIFLGGITGRIKGYIHLLTLKIDKKKFIAPVVFSYEYKVSFNLLGRDSVFKQFAITFDERNLLTKFE